MITISDAEADVLLRIAEGTAVADLSSDEIDDLRAVLKACRDREVRHPMEVWEQIEQLETRVEELTLALMENGRELGLVRERRDVAESRVRELEESNAALRTTINILKDPPSQWGET